MKGRGRSSQNGHATFDEYARDINFRMCECRQNCSPSDESKPTSACSWFSFYLLAPIILTLVPWLLFFVLETISKHWSSDEIRQMQLVATRCQPTKCHLHVNRLFLWLRLFTSLAEIESLKIHYLLSLHMT